MKNNSLSEQLPDGMKHHIFTSHLCRRDIGYIVYLPSDYETTNISYPVHYHFHGWRGNEYSDVAVMEAAYRNENTVFVFPSIPEEEDLPVERMFFDEFIPEIERLYRISSVQRTISGFSMGGGMAVWYACKHPGMFTDVIAYAGTFHHYYHKDFMTPYVSVERAEELYRGMLQTNWESDKNLLAWFDRTPRDAFCLELRVGTDDPLYCDAEVLHKHLVSHGFPHTYKIVAGVGHSLADIV